MSESTTWPRRVLLSLGSNLEPRRERLDEAYDQLSDGILTNCRCSKQYATAPVGYTEQPEFVNGCIVGFTTLEPEDLVAACREIENSIGRQHRQRWREREIDIDVVLMDDCVINTTDVSIPHPRMHERRFVLVPAAEIAPDMVHPLFGKTVAELLAACPDTSSVSPL